MCDGGARSRHEVHLVDEQEGVGGMVRLAAIPAFKRDVKNYLEWMEHTVAQRAGDNRDFKLMLGTEATLAMLEDGKYDAIVCATGSREKAPAVEGVDKAVFARTLLRDVSLLDGKEKVVVVGGGTVGCEVALMLAAEYGLKVTVLEMLPTLMPHICTANRTHLIHELEKHGVTLMNCAKLEKIEDGSVAVNVNESPTVPDPYNTWNPFSRECAESSGKAYKGRV